MHRLIFILVVALFFASCSPFVTKYDRMNLPATLDNDEPVHLHNSLEWWYATGHLKTADGREFGIEYVFFHFTTRSGKSSNYMVNFAITDPQTQAFYYDYQFAKAKHTPEAGILPLDLKMGEYSFAGQQGYYALKAGMDQSDVAISLSTTPAKEPVFQNGTGYEIYGDIATAGYFSYPRLDTEGYLIIAADTLQVSGQLWYDRQWNCGSDLIGGGASWDWMSVQFDQAEEELMVYRVEDRKKGKELFGGSFHRADGTVDYLESQEIQMTPLAFWVSPDTRRSYPVRWKVTVPHLGIDIEVQAAVPHQELILTRLGFKLPYWEGMCHVSGVVAGQERSGDAYLEMTNRRKVKN